MNSVPTHRPSRKLRDHEMPAKDLPQPTDLDSRLTALRRKQAGCACISFLYTWTLNSIFNLVFFVSKKSLTASSDRSLPLLRLLRLSFSLQFGMTSC